MDPTCALFDNQEARVFIMNGKPKGGPAVPSDKVLQWIIEYGMFHELFGLADSVRELVKWTYEVDLFHGLSYSERQALCMECDGELVDQHEALVGVGQSLTKVSKTPSWPS